MPSRINLEEQHEVELPYDKMKQIDIMTPSANSRMNDDSHH